MGVTEREMTARRELAAQGWKGSRFVNNRYGDPVLCRYLATIGFPGTKPLVIGYEMTKSEVLQSPVEMRPVGICIASDFPSTLAIERIGRLHEEPEDFQLIVGALNMLRMNELKMPFSQWESALHSQVEILYKPNNSSTNGHVTAGHLLYVDPHYYFVNRSSDFYPPTGCNEQDLIVNVVEPQRELLKQKNIDLRPFTVQEFNQALSKLRAEVPRIEPS